MFVFSGIPYRFWNYVIQKEDLLRPTYAKWPWSVFEKGEFCVAVIEIDIDIDIDIAKLLEAPVLPGTILSLESTFNA
ncbi:hypothetical protein N7528_001766 [Penicillium herquei]|nr:hypothetical protein N7528_001766 [Penicillium herquei]